MSRPHRRWWLPLFVLLTAVSLLRPLHAAPAGDGAPGDDMEEEGDFDAWVEGSQEINFFREQLAAGTVPQPSTITAEAILNPYPLPIGVTLGCSGNLCFSGAVAESDLLTRPDLLYVAGFSLFQTFKVEEWKRPPLNIVAVVDMSGARKGEVQELVRDSLRLIIGNLKKGDQFSIVVRGTQARVWFRPQMVALFNKGPMHRAAKSIELVTGGADDAIRTGYDLAKSTAAKFKGATRVFVLTDHQPDLRATGAGSFRVAIDEGAAAGIGLTMVGIGVKFSTELTARVGGTRGCTVRSFSNPADLKSELELSLDEMVTNVAQDIEVVITPRRGLRIEGVYGLPRYLLSWDGTGRGMRLRLGALFRSPRSKVFYVTLASERGDLERETAAPGEGPVLKARYSFRAVLEGDTSGAEQQFDVPTVPLLASQGLRRGVALLSEYLALRAAARAFLLDNNPERTRALLTDAGGILATEADLTLAPEQALVQQFFAALSAAPGKAVAQADAEVVPSAGADGKKAKSRAPQQALWGAWYAESSTDESRVGDTLCFFPGGTMIVFRGLDEEADSTGREVVTRAYSLWSGILRFGERTEAWDWSVADDQLFLEGRGPLRGVDITLKRVPMPAAAEAKNE
jgi:Ca-activated chloride channel family protein